jgi:hypothetical protein
MADTIVLFHADMCGVGISQRWRETSEEKRELERLEFDILNEVRHAAEVHRQVFSSPNPFFWYEAGFTL